MRNFKKTGRALLIAAAAIGMFAGLDFLLYPCTFIRNDLHTVCAEAFDDIYLGTSHGKLNIDPEAAMEVSGRTGHNLCVGGEYSIDAYYMLKLLLERGNAPSRVIYEISPVYFTMEKEEGNNYLLFYHEFPLSRAKLEYFRDAVAKCNFRTLLYPWYEYEFSYELENMGTTVRKKLQRDYGIGDFKTDTQEYHESGFVERYPVDDSGFSFSGIRAFHREEIRQEHMEYLEKLIRLCREQGIAFVAVTTPVPAATLQKFSEEYEDADSYFGDFFEEQGVDYINFNNREYYKYASHKAESYTDLDGHMNGDAAREFSRNLARVLGQLQSAGGKRL